MENPDKRAKELHDLIENSRTRRHSTTAVGNTKEKIAIVGTSEDYLRKDIKNALKENEIPAKSREGNHAEENVIDEADEKKLTITEIGASRPVCLDCENKIKEKGIEPKTEFSGKKSRKRKDN